MDRREIKQERARLAAALADAVLEYQRVQEQLVAAHRAKTAAIQAWVSFTATHPEPEDGP